MTEQTDKPEETGFDIGKEIAEANAHLPIDLSQQVMPLDMTIRSTALTLAVRHCGDTVVREGNLYQHLKMDNKLGGPLTVNHVIHAALIFERFLWGEWSKGLAGEAMASAMDEMESHIKEHLSDEEIEPQDRVGEDEAPPIRPHSGE